VPAFERRFVVALSGRDLSILNARLLSDHGQIPIVDANLYHTAALDAKRKELATGEKAIADLDGPIQMLICEDRLAGSYATYDGDVANAEPSVNDLPSKSDTPGFTWKNINMALAPDQA